ncbi:MAG: polysaccharide biosynthesis tyrosine autokinase [Deltaproteobacteria bacterium]|nr:polysaccharide biosynthesis tyrosine autokinase [Deltaproteobacteria bacterium]
MSDEIKAVVRTPVKNYVIEKFNSLPSTEVREPIPDWNEEEVHLRDYIDVLVRRKWLIISFLALTLVSTLIMTMASPKSYKASATIEISPQQQKVTKFEEVITSNLLSREFYETQVELIQSPAVMRRVIEKLNLAEHQVITNAVFGKGNPGITGWVKAHLLSLVPVISTNKDVKLEISEKDLNEQKLVKFIDGNLDVSTSRTSMLVDVAFSSTDRHLSREIVNTLVEEFVHWKMEKKMGASKLARHFLMKQIDRAKIDLEKAEEAMNRFARQSGIVSLDSKVNSIYRQLEEIISAQAVAEADLIGKEAVYKQAVEDGPSSLPQVMKSKIISDLKAEYARLRSRYEDQKVTFYDAYPAVKALKARMASLSRRIRSEENKIFLSLENEYRAALKKVQSLQESVARQRQLAMDLNERATQYNIMIREVETNKEIYQSLLERTKEIESMAGVSSSNIQIVNKASLPLLPFKPRVRLNLLLALLLGLLGGVGFAFFLEYFNDAITNPDEIADRFQIPILGVIPFEKANGHPVEQTFAFDPMSPLSEALRTTKLSIQLSGTGRQSKTLLFTSTKTNEGKSTLAANLTLAFACAGEKVILIDTDLRKPQIHKIFDAGFMGNSGGLSKFLAGFKHRDLIIRNSNPGFHFIAAGPIPPNPVELLASRRFSNLIRFLEKHYDRIILDGPPYLGFADVLVMGQHVGGIVLVSSIGETTRAALRDFKKSVVNCRGKILGCIINKVPVTRGYGYHSYYNYSSDLRQRSRLMKI